MNNDKKKNVLMICPFAKPNLGGVESHLDKLIKEATEKGYYITLLTYQPLTTDTTGKHFEKEELYEIHRVPWFAKGLFPKVENYFPLVFLYLFPGLFLYSLGHYLRNHSKYRTIHAHGLTAALIAQILTKIKAKNSVVSTHAVYQFQKRNLLSWLVFNILKSFDTILAVSKVSQEELIGMGLPREKVKVHPNWIDTEKFAMREQGKAKKALNLEKEFNLLYLGRLLPQKGINLILETAEKLPEIGFHLVGNGPLERKVEEKSSKVDNINYYGVLSQNDDKDFEKIINLYNACDYFLSPYTYDEGFSTTLIESLSCGTPVIVTDRGSPPTFLSEKVAVYLSETPNENEIISLLKKLKTKTGNHEDYRLKCRRFAEENFGPKNAKTIIESYETN